MPDREDYHQIIICGAGPAGCSASFILSKNKIKHTLIDKAVFPRDKICGDALSGKVINILKNISVEWANELTSNTELFAPSKGVIFVSPNNTILSIPFKHEYKPEDKAPGFVSKRMDFDNFLFKKTTSPYCNSIENCKLENIEPNNDGLKLTLNNGGKPMMVQTKLLISADGARSLAAKHLANISLDPKHYSGGIRAYYSGVKNLNKDGYIELIFLKNYLPGYFWIFPLPNGWANVGAGMLTDAISKQKIDLKKMMLDTIANHPDISIRFESAKLEDSIKGWGLPLGSKKRKLSGEHFMLCGDAASLIDPFTGEGIAPAMLSGQLAATTAIKALEIDNYSASFLKQYDTMYYKKTWGETRLSYLIQRLIMWPRLFNMVVSKASNNKELQKTITSMFANVDLRKKFMNPLFYIRLLFNK